MDTLFFVLSKLLRLLIQVESWVVVLLALALLALVRGRLRAGRRWLTGGLVALIALGTVPLGDLALRPLETAFPVEPKLDRVDGIVVLGGGEDAERSRRWSQPQLNEGAERFTAALALARSHPQARVVFTGGSGALSGMILSGRDGASVAEAFFATQGLEPPRLLLEAKSRNTAENAVLSRALAAPGPGETWVLVTSAFHMPRALDSFRAAGWEGLMPYPVDYRTRALVDALGWNLARNLDLLNTAIKEQVGRLVYRLSGR